MQNPRQYNMVSKSVKHTRFDTELTVMKSSWQANGIDKPYPFIWGLIKYNGRAKFWGTYYYESTGGYRKAFANFDPKVVARFSEKKIKKLLLNPAIIRNRLKVTAAISNAKAFLKIQYEFGSFDQYAWRFVGEERIVNKWRDFKDIPAITKEDVDIYSFLRLVAKLHCKK